MMMKNSAEIAFPEHKKDEDSSRMVGNSQNPLWGW
jgi:hypothetical protein